ncbi:hypothetical protein SO802_005307 [Lithocarpus litseifolius]|uniref:Reverse transcriptase zinc-binding domain-containing protein n=1 Tax=Lithocarpus litseifolius TaxID=425828 RepID=A0AAW2DJ53_9ROSI
MDVCEECNNGLENSGHLFWSCQRARQIWQCTKLSFAFEPTAISSFFDLVWHLMMIEEFDEDKVATVVTIAWSIWVLDEEVGCACSCHCKCWRHHFKGAKIKNVARIEDKRHIDHRVLLFLLPTLPIDEKIQFILDWEMAGSIRI